MCLKCASSEVKHTLKKIKMETKKAIELAGSATLLASMLGITDSAVSQWGKTIPESRVWQLRVLRPEWFLPKQAVTGKRATAKVAG